MGSRSSLSSNECDSSNEMMRQKLWTRRLLYTLYTFLPHVTYTQSDATLPSSTICFRSTLAAAAYQSRQMPPRAYCCLSPFTSACRVPPYRAQCHRLPVLATFGIQLQGSLDRTESSLWCRWPQCSTYFFRSTGNHIPLWGSCVHCMASCTARMCREEAVDCPFCCQAQRESHLQHICCQ